MPRFRAPHIWGIEKQQYPKEHGAFTRCHDRVRDGKCPSIDWPRTPEGFLQFLLEIGKIPDHLIKPSIGRKNHNIGYVSGNIQWEEHTANSTKRKGTRYEQITEAEFERIDRSPKWKKGSIEHKEHQKKATEKRWSNPEAKEQQSKRMLGNSYARRY